MVNKNTLNCGINNHLEHNKGMLQYGIDGRLIPIFISFYRIGVVSSFY